MKKRLLLFALAMVSFQFTFGQCTIVYVSTNGSPTAAGTKTDPKDIVTAFSTSATGTLIRIATGVYTIDYPLSIPSNDIIVEGGFIMNEDWTKTSLQGATTILRSTTDPEGSANQQRLVALQAVNKSGFEVHDITIQTADANAPGMSTYGVYLDGCSSYKFVRCWIDAGNAANGAAGVAGTQGLNGSNGSNGSAGSVDGNCDGGLGGSGGLGGGTGGGTSGSSGVNPSGCDQTGGNGGTGGTSSNARAGGAGGGGGAGGETSSGGGAGGAGGGVNGGATQTGGGVGGGSGDPGGTGSNGTNGAAGAAGTMGAAGSANSLGAFFVPGGQGGNGTDGAGGKGGVGGGGGGGQDCFFCDNGSGDGAGGGGGGGQGGTGGTGGYGGGGSFGAYLNANGATGSFIDCKVIAGTAGLGGAGGTGGAGGAGGAGGVGSNAGSNEVGAGGNGGNGGNGGAGGAGGSGANGVTAAIQLASGSALVVGSSSFNLDAQPVIKVSYSACFGPTISVEDDTLAVGTGNTSWSFGGNATPSTGTDNPQSVVYNALGFNNIVHGTNTYRSFVYYCCESLAGLEEEVVATISLYPNPNDGTFTIDLGETVSQMSIEIRDINGRLVYTNTYENTASEQIQLEQPAGIYFVQVNKEGSSTMHRVIKN